MNVVMNGKTLITIVIVLIVELVRSPIMKNNLKAIQDVIFFSTIGLLCLSIVIFVIPFYLGKEAWIRFENWLINK